MTITTVVRDFFLPSQVSSKGSELGRESFPSQHKRLLSYWSSPSCRELSGHFEKPIFVFPLPVLYHSSLFFTENLGVGGFLEIRFRIRPAIWKFLLPVHPQTASNGSGKLTWVSCFQVQTLTAPSPSKMALAVPPGFSRLSRFWLVP